MKNYDYKLRILNCATSISCSKSHCGAQQAATCRDFLAFCVNTLVSVTLINQRDTAL